MSNFQQNSTRSEKQIAKAEISKLAIIPDVILSIIILVFGLNCADEMYGLKETISVFTFILAAVIILIPLVGILKTELALTNKRLVGKLGIINTKSLDAPLNKINNISLSQGLFGKIFGYSKIDVSTSSGNFIFKYIKSADALKNMIMEQIDIAEEERIRIQAERMNGYRS